MKVTLQVSGREMTFSEKELKAILEKHFSNQTIKQVEETTQVVQGPEEGKWFKVNPLAIDQNLFKEKRSDSGQERARKLILEAFEEVKKNSKYAKPFKTMMPEKTWENWERKTVGELKKLASKMGDHNADWVEQALEWAQRIANGETWKSICNEPDTTNWYRFVVWKNGYARLVGGSRKNCINISASSVDDYNYYDYDICNYAVPFVVLYE